MGVAVSVGGWFLAHRHGTLRGALEREKAPRPALHLRRQRGLMGEGMPSRVIVSKRTFRLKFPPSFWSEFCATQEHILVRAVEPRPGMGCPGTRATRLKTGRRPCGDCGPLPPKPSFRRAGPNHGAPRHRR